jgi:hypothetical protein
MTLSQLNNNQLVVPTFLFSRTIAFSAPNAVVAWTTNKTTAPIKGRDVFIR